MNIQDLKKGNYLVVDVRENEEVAEHSYPGALHIPMGQISERLSELPKDRPLAILCRSGNRSGTVTAYLKAQGFEAENIEGGILAM